MALDSDVIPVDSASEAGPRWAARLRDLCIDLRAAPDHERSPLEEQVWLLLHAGLLRYLRAHALRRGIMTPEDLEDVASERAFDLLQRVISGRWETSHRHAGEVAAFLASVARNAVIDHARHSIRVARRRVRVPAPSHDSGAPASIAFDDPAHAVERREAASTLASCVERLAPRARRIWFMRVMLELPSGTIADHPEVRLNAKHVDVILQRVRREVRDCFEHQGLDVRTLPRNAFVEIWDRLVSLADSERATP
jgi:RNA polymerase sigma factor (sigma-70 family)